MDYGRFNYVAQPGDGARLIPIVGPYDEFAVEWGYREFPDAKTYEQEKKELEKIAARQLEDPKLRFGDPNPARGPVAADRGPRLRPDPRHRAGAQEHRPRRRLPGQGHVEGGRELRPACGRSTSQLIAQRNRELGHVANLVGGFVRNELLVPRGEEGLHARPGRPAEEGRGVPDRTRLPHAALADRPGHPRPARVARQRRADPLRPADAAADASSTRRDSTG